MTDDPKRDTGFLGEPEAEPMQDRPPRPGTNILGPQSKLLVKIGDQKVVLDLEATMLVGRVTEGENAAEYSLDLGPFDGYQNGVSRHHATITQHDGGLYLEDLGSTNGTRINGFQLTPRRKYRLRDGDEVEFARLRTLVRFVNPQT